MTKETFNAKLFAEFTFEEIEAINPVIYFSPKHIDYYISYQCGDYLACWQYLLANRRLLSPARVKNPKEKKKAGI